MAIKQNESLEKLIEKSARLLLWYDGNHERFFKNYFNAHFYHIRTLGYLVCCEQFSDSVEIYFRDINNPEYRTIGIKFKNEKIL